MLEVYKEQRFVGSSQIIKSCFTMHTQIRALAKHKSWLDFSNKSSHHLSNPREESKDCFILLKEYFT
jgi:hypothetical protein